MASVEGKVVSVSEITKVGTKGTEVRMLVLDIQGNSTYENYAEIKMMGDKCKVGDSLKPGQNIDVQYFISGRKWLNPSTEKEMIIQELMFNSASSVKRESIS